MSKEHERKYLVVGQGWREEVIKTASIRQAYIAVTDTVEVRVRATDEQAWLTIKSQDPGVTRLEHEVALDVKDANALVSEFGCEGMIEKERHYLDRSSQIWTVDIFRGANNGLHLLEIEDDHPFVVSDLPPWVGEEVTFDARYRNSYLSTFPFASW